MPACAVVLGFDCAAHGHRIKIASGVAARSASLNFDPAPAHKGLAPARTMDQSSAVSGLAAAVLGTSPVPTNSDQRLGSIAHPLSSEGGHDR